MPSYPIDSFAPPQSIPPGPSYSDPGGIDLAAGLPAVSLFAVAAPFAPAWMTPSVGSALPTGYSANPIRYASGEIRMISKELAASGYGQDWGHTRSFSNRIIAVTGTGSNGNSWFVREVPVLGKDASGHIAVIGIVNDALWFDKSGSPPVYTARFFIAETLTEDTANKEFNSTDTRGQITTFYNFDGSIAAAKQGQLKRITNPHGDTYTPTYDGNNLISSLAIGGSPTSTFDYSYSSGKLQYVTQKRGTTDVRRAEYAYYGAGSGNGNSGDLQMATVQQWNGSGWDTLGTSYYRYYTSNTYPGYQYGLKYVLRPQAYAAAKAYGQSLNPQKTVDELTDTQLAPFADHYFGYHDSTDKRVREEVVNGQGTASASTTATYQYAYTASGNTPGYNNWHMRTVGTSPNVTVDYVYTNYAGQVMLKIWDRVSDSKKWYEYFQYDAKGRVSQHALSSAIASFSQSSPGLVTLNTSSGLIRVFTYDATSGFLEFEKVKKRSSGTEIPVRKLEYTSQTVGGKTIYLVSKEIRYQTDSGGGSPVEVLFSYVFFSGTLAVQQRTTTWPAIPTSQNGSGSTNSRVEVFDEYGFLTWIKDERGFLTRFKTDQGSGGILQRIDDVNVSSISDSPAVPSGWTTPSGGGLHLITDYTLDNLGRTTLESGPEHGIDIGGANTTVRWVNQVLYRDAVPEIWQAGGYATGATPTYTLIEPMSVTKLDWSGRVTDSIVAERVSGASGLLNPAGSPADSFADQTRWVRWTKSFYNNNERLANYQFDYFDIPSSDGGSSGTNYNRADFGFDVMGRPNRVLTPAGTITRRVYDPRGLEIGLWLGTNDTGATDDNPAGSGSPNNMLQVEAYEYDGGDAAASGDGNLTKLTRYQDSNTSNNRVTTYGYDFRNRLETADGEVDFFEKYFYDNQDRPTKTERRNATSTGTLLAQSETKFDDLGRVFQSIQCSVISGSVGNSLKEKIWYSPTGQVIKRVPMGTQVFQKKQYDGVGRVTKSFVCFDFSEADTDYSAAGTVTNDTVLQQTESLYDAATNLIQGTRRDRFHDASGTGELTSPGGAQPKARVSYLALYPDALGRPQAAANYGTNAAASFTRPSTKPAGSDTVLVSQTDYNTRGEPFQTTDPKGIVTLRGFDDAGRVFQKVEDRYGVVRTTDFTYTADNQLATLTAVNGVTGNQTTTWTYGTTLADSDVASNDLLRFEQYPDGSASDRVEYKYNRLGELKEIKDQSGTIRSLKYDKLGRLEHDCADTLGSGVDSAVRRLTRSYEARGLLEKLTSYDNANVGSGSIVNEVKYEYNGFMLLTKESQSHQGAVTASTPAVQYACTDGSSNHARRIKITYPDNTVQDLEFGIPECADNACNRVEYLKCGTAVGVDYKYLGVGQVVMCCYSCEPSVELTYFTAGQTGEAGDQYTGLDRFGRVIDQCWCKTTPASDKERVKYGFDRASNRKWRQNTVADALSKKEDEYYTYDALDQVKSLDRGTLNAGKTGITGTPTWEEDWNYDLTGNWYAATMAAYLTKVDGTTTLDQSRTHNVVNELTAVTNTTGTAWTTPSYDMLGSFISTPQPQVPSSSFGLKWDAWNRMVEVSAGGNFVARWAYDGANRRVSQLNGEEFRHYYYSDQWQVLEERTGDNAYAERRFIWGRRGVDDLICRDRGNERLYVLNDGANVTAVVNVVGAVQERYGYSGFGVPRYMDANFDSRSSSSFDWETLFGGYRYDAKTGLYLPRNRILHARLGRWLSRDSIGYRAGTNLYGGMGNRPMNAVDPFGLDPVTFSPKTAERYGITLISREAAIALKGEAYVTSLDPEYNVFDVDSTRLDSYLQTQPVRIVSSELGFPISGLPIVESDSPMIDLDGTEFPNMGGGIAGAIATMNAGTRIWVNGRAFVFSLMPRAGSWVPASGSTSILFITDPVRLNIGLRLDYGFNVATGTADWHWNQRGVSAAFRVSNHATAGAATAGAFVNTLKYGGRALIVGGIFVSGVEIATSAHPVYETGRQASGWAGAAAGGALGAKGGAAVGAAIGVWFGGIGAAPRAIIGGFLGGLGGGALGWFGGTKAYGSVVRPPKP